MKSKCTSFYCPYCGSIIDLCDDDYTEVFKSFSSYKDNRSWNANSVELIPPPGLMDLYPGFHNEIASFSYFNLNPWSDELLKYKNKENFKIDKGYKEGYSALIPPSDDIKFSPGHKIDTLEI